MSQEALVRAGIALGIAVAVWIVGWVLTRVLLPRLAHLVSRSNTQLDDILIASVRPHVPLWFLALGVMAGAHWYGFSDEVNARIELAARAGVLLSLTIATAVFVGRLLSSRAAPWLAAMPSTGLVQNSARIGVLVLGGMMVLANLGISITPILTALGVGSLAVALALQPTLTNLFAGFYITLARQIQVDDYVELETGQKGFVTDIGWRTTTIRELPNNLIVIPNLKLAELIVTNYSLPVTEQSIVIQVGVSYASDLPKVERVTIEVAKEVQTQVEGAVPEFEPFTRYHTFGDSSINFSVILRVKSFVDRYLVTHEFTKRLHARYEQENIEIPFPQRVLHFEPDEVPALADAVRKGAD